MPRKGIGQCGVNWSKVDLKNDSAEWQAFAKKLRRLLRDGIRLRRQDDSAPDKYRDRTEGLNKRLGRSPPKSTRTVMRGD